MNHWPFKRHDGVQSIFATDPRFTPNGRGLSRSQTTTETVARITRETGRSPGSIPGLSDSSDARLGQQKGW